MTTGGSVRIGIIGAGNFANTHLEEYAKVDGVEVVALCRRNPDGLKAIQDKWGIETGYTDYREMLKSGDIDAVDIITPTNAHNGIALEAIAAGKHVLCDKPLAMTALEAEEMLEAAEKAGIVHCTNFNQRGRTPAGQIKQLIDDGYIGDVYHMNIYWYQSHSIDVRPDAISWRFQKEYGGGTLYELIHTFDMALLYGGPVKRVTAVAPTMEKHRPFADAPDGADVTVPDSSGILLEFETGAYAVIHTSFVSRGLDEGNNSNVHIDVAGSKGRLRSDSLSVINGITGEGNRDILRPVEPIGTYPQPYQQFVEAIRDSVPVRTSFEAGLDAARIRDAAQKAADTGQWVVLS
jgi:predicted dehydrogenase